MELLVSRLTWRKRAALAAPLFLDLTFACNAICERQAAPGEPANIQRFLCSAQNFVFSVCKYLIRTYRFGVMIGAKPGPMPAASSSKTDVLPLPES